MRPTVLIAVIFLISAGNCAASATEQDACYSSCSVSSDQQWATLIGCSASSQLHSLQHRELRDATGSVSFEVHELAAPEQRQHPAGPRSRTLWGAPAEECTNELRRCLDDGLCATCIAVGAVLTA